MGFSPMARTPIMCCSSRNPAWTRSGSRSKPRRRGRLLNWRWGRFTLAALFTSKGPCWCRRRRTRCAAGDFVYHRFGNVSQVELPKSPGGLDSLAYFKYALPAPGPAAAQAPLENWNSRPAAAWRKPKRTTWCGSRATATLGTSKPRRESRPNRLGRGRFSRRPFAAHPPHRAGGIGLDTGAGLSGRVALDECVAHGGTRGWAMPLEVRWEEEGSEQRGPDGARRARLKVVAPKRQERAADDPRQVRGSAGARRVQVELPRPLGSVDRGGTISVASGPLVELLTARPARTNRFPIGAIGSPEPTARRPRLLAWALSGTGSSAPGGPVNIRPAGPLATENRAAAIDAAQRSG